MAKREFIERTTMLDDGSGFHFDKPITEQDIVKPYLTKLKAKMFDLPKAEGKTYWDAVDDIGDMIDGLLSEQGDTDGNVD